jgi:hypothetical protein
MAEENKKFVEIPKCLADKLDVLGPHFCLVGVKSKNPNVGGRGWQKPEKLMLSTDPKLKNWLAKGGNYGVVGGFGLVIADADISEVRRLIEEKLPKSFTVESPGSHGWHAYYLCGLEKPIRLRDKEGENVGDIQGPGKMVVGPNSIHPNGGVYRVVKDVPLAQVTKDQLAEALKPYVVPGKVIQRVEETAGWEKRETRINLDILQVVPLAGLHRRGSEYFGPHPVHGSQHGKDGKNFWVNPSKNVWHCFRHDTGGGPLLWLAVEDGIIECAEAIPGVLRGEVFKQVLRKARERGLIKNEKEFSLSQSSPSKKESQADRLIRLCLAQNPILFHDQHKTPYVRIQQSKVNVTLPVRSKPFRTWLASLLWQDEEKAPGTEAVYSALNVLEAMAVFNGPKHTLYNRVAPALDGFWIDMADDKWRAIKVTAAGWEIVDNPPILFKRYSHQLPLVEPKHGGSPWKFLEFINVNDEDEEGEATQLTLLCALVSYFVPLIPHVILVLYGIQGSGKTMFFKLVRRLIDPSAVDVLTLPRDERERVQQLDHHWCAFYDNVTRLPSWMSDTLCRAATGGGFTKRELYTDDQDIIYNFKRCVGLNGINIAAQRGDLLDRSLLIGLKDIPKNRRRTEKQLLNDFEGCKAEILGSFLDTLVRAVEVYPRVNPEGLFRMADFTRWGCAIAVALGKQPEDFINAYEKKVKMQIEEAAHSSPVATVLLDWLEFLFAKGSLDSKKWEGTPSELYSALLKRAKDLGMSTRQKVWPKAPHVLVRQLNELAPSLKMLGWEVVTGIKSGSKRRININSVSSVPSVPVQPEEPKDEPKKDGKRDARDARDASGLTSSSDVPILTQKNVEYVFTILHEQCKHKKYVTLDELILTSKMDRAVLLGVLGSLQREGKAIQFRPDMWRPT